jgi:hypothetical protein
MSLAGSASNGNRCWLFSMEPNAGPKANQYVPFLRTTSTCADPPSNP